jgi:hypothetical protein
MTEDLMTARASFYRRFAVIGAAAVGHLGIMLSCLALMLIGKTMIGALGLFVVGHVALIGLFAGAWQRLKAEYPSTISAAVSEARGEVSANPFDARRTTAVGAFRVGDRRNEEQIEAVRRSGRAA